jgi:cytochrome c oxidase assembly protein subunit 15
MLWLWRADDRKWLKWLGFVALLSVILQGVLGGLTVLFLLPKAVSIGHASLAQMFFATTVAIAQRFLTAAPPFFPWRRWFSRASAFLRWSRFTP